MPWGSGYDEVRIIIMPEPEAESLFQDALLDTCNWLEEHGYPMVGLFSLIKESGAVAAAKQALASDNWSDGLVELWGCEETRRSLEALVIRPGFCSLFTDEERDIAKARLDNCSPAPHTEGEAILDPVSSTVRLIMKLASGVPAQPPTSGVRTTADPSRYNNLNPHQRIEQQERDLNSGLPLQATSRDRSHLEECAQCAEAHPAVVEAYCRLDSNAVDKLRDLLVVLKICLDCSWHKMKLLLEQMNLSSKRPDDRECWDVDESTFDIFCSEAEINLLPLLEHRAAMVAAHVGYFIKRYASTIAWRKDKLLQLREGVGPAVVADFVRGLDRDDFLNLLIADQCYLVWPGYDPVDVLRVPSHGEFQPVEGVLETEGFPFLPLERTPSFNFGYFMDCVRDGALWRHPECMGAQYGRPELGTATPTTSSDEVSPPRREPSLEDRWNRLEASVRKAMGGDLFEQLVPQARPSALQAEYLFQHWDCPEPSDIVFTLARAFEIQMRDGWLKGFADYLVGKDILEYPEGRYQTLLYHGKFQKERLTLEKMREVLDTGSCHLDGYCAKHGSDPQIVRAALGRVISLRNQAGHQGCLSFELAKQIRSDWLGQSRRGEGIFQAVLPCGLPPTQNPVP
jgi:hypothetical protein